MAHLTILRLFVRHLMILSLVDGKHAVFGRVTNESFETLKAIEQCVQVFEREDKCRARVLKQATISDCGVLTS